LKKHLVEATPRQRTAAACGGRRVKTLVLSHIVPSEDPAVTDQMWIDAARATSADGDPGQGLDGDLRGRHGPTEPLAEDLHGQEAYRGQLVQPTAALSLSMIASSRPTTRGDHRRRGRSLDTRRRLLAGGYENVTVLDVSGVALAEASARLGGNATRVTWLEANILDAALPASAYHVWHDRAVFHFLTDPADRRRYVEQVTASVRVAAT